jgi:hypothetical protein
MRPRIEEEPLRVLEDVGLVHERDLLAPVRERVLERVAHDALGAEARDHRDRLGRGARIIADAHVVLVPDVQPFGVLAHEHEIDVVEAAGHDGAGRTHIRVEIERLAQRHVDRAEPFAHRRLERSLERDARLLDGIERGVGHRVAPAADAGDAGDLGIPGDVGAGGGEDADGGVGDRRADAVAGDQCDGSRHACNLSRGSGEVTSCRE